MQDNLDKLNANAEVDKEIQESEDGKTELFKDIFRLKDGERKVLERLLEQAKFFIPIMADDDMTADQLEKIVSEKLMKTEVWKLCDDYYLSIIKPLVRGRQVHYNTNGKPEKKDDTETEQLQL